MSWDLVIKAVEAHTDQPWVVVYVKRWLHAPLQQANGTLTERDRGTPQGSAVSPVLGSSRLSRLSATSMTRSCTVSASGRPARCWPRSVYEWNRSGCDCIPTRPGSSTARTGNGAAATSTRRLRSWGMSFGSERRGTSTAAVQRVLARDQQAGPEANQCSGAVVATAPPHWSHPRRPRAMDQSDRAGLDAVLRGVLPFRAVSTPDTHQRLPGALDPQEIQATARRAQSHRVLEGDRFPVPPPVCALAMGSLGGVRLVDQEDKSPVTGDCHAGICGSPGVRSPGPPDRCNLM